MVGVRLTIGSFPAGGLEFKAIGTAVRAPGGAALREPFTSDLSGQDFAKLIMAGWVPAGLVLGISVGARHDDWLTVSQTRWGAGNAEVPGYTDLVNATRHDARHQLERDVARHRRRRRGAAADEHAGRRARVPRRRKGAGTTSSRRPSSAPRSRASASRAGTGQQPPLAIMSLDPQRRQAARVRLGP